MADAESFLSDNDREVVKCLVARPSHAHYAALNAVAHISRAWKLREIDQPMALFRAITAEEEAATALILTLKNKRYPGAKALGAWQHPAKLALYPFSREVWQMVGPFAADTKPELVVRHSEKSSRLDVRYHLRGQSYFSDPPLNMILGPGSIARLSAVDPATVDDSLLTPVTPETLGAFVKESTSPLQRALAFRLREGAQAAGGEFKAVIKKIANRRNKALFAGAEGFPSGIGDLEIRLHEQRMKTFWLLTIYCLIFPHRKRATVVEQVLPLFPHFLQMSEAELAAIYWPE